MYRNTFKFTLVAGLIAGFSGLAVASTSGLQGEDDLTIGQTHVSLIQAVATAEQKVGGKATHAELENENGKPVFGVEVVTGSSATDVKVDAMTGQVLSAQADKSDADHEGEGEVEN